jgi:hypothetical protein
MRYGTNLSVLGVWKANGIGKRGVKRAGIKISRCVCVLDGFFVGETHHTRYHGRRGVEQTVAI